MNIPMTGLLVLLMASLAPQAANAGLLPSDAGLLPSDDCMAMTAEARHLNPEVIEVTAHISWACKPEMLKEAFAKMIVNGEPLGAVGSFDGMAFLEVKAATTAKLPMTVCVAIEGRGETTGSVVNAVECDPVSVFIVDLPKPRLPLMQVVPRF